MMVDDVGMIALTKIPHHARLVAVELSKTDDTAQIFDILTTISFYDGGEELWKLKIEAFAIKIN